jgi:DNA polymerase III gamma/tau subunit
VPDINCGRYHGFSGEKRIFETLSAFFSAGRFPHAVLFCGGNEIGRKTLADDLAQILICKKRNGFNACKECNSCIKMEKRIHPDIIYVKELSGSGKYKVEILREEIRRGSYLPNDGELRIYIFADVDTMSEICQNTLLKFIEEPKSFNRFIFTAESDRAVLPTILSRVVSIRSDELGDDNVSEETSESQNLVLEIAEQAVRALSERDEYMLTVALSRVKTREIMLSMLTLLPEKIRNSIFYKNNVLFKDFNLEKLIKIFKKLEVYIKEQDFNPNLTLISAAYSAGIFEEVQD